MIQWNAEDGRVAVVDAIYETGYLLAVYESEAARLCAAPPTSVMDLIGRPNRLDIGNALAGFTDASTSPYDDQPSVPASVSARQIRLWLIRNGIALSQVDAAIDAIPDQLQRDSVRVEWDYAPYVERSHPMLVPLAAALGLATEQVDQAFIEAATI